MSSIIMHQRGNALGLTVSLKHDQETRKKRTNPSHKHNLHSNAIFSSQNTPRLLKSSSYPPSAFAGISNGTTHAFTFLHAKTTHPLLIVHSLEVPRSLQRPNVADIAEDQNNDA